MYMRASLGAMRAVRRKRFPHEVLVRYLKRIKYTCVDRWENEKVIQELWTALRRKRYGWNMPSRNYAFEDEHDLRVTWYNRLPPSKRKDLLYHPHARHNELHSLWIDGVHMSGLLANECKAIVALHRQAIGVY